MIDARRYCNLDKATAVLSSGNRFFYQNKGLLSSFHRNFMHISVERKVIWLLAVECNERAI